MKDITTLRNEIFSELGETSGNSIFSTADIDGWINEGYQELLSFIDQSLLYSSYHRILGATTILIASTVGDTSITVDSIGNIQVGDRIMIFDSADAEYRKVVATTSPDIITVDYPLQKAFATGTTVSVYGCAIPPYKEIVGASIVETNSNSNELWYSLNQVSLPVYVREKMSVTPNDLARGKNIYSVIPAELTLVESFSAGTGTTTTKVTKNVLYDFSKICLLKNLTHAGMERVESVGTTDFTIENAITGQVATDSCQLWLDAPTLVFAPPANYKNIRLDLYYTSIISKLLSASNPYLSLPPQAVMGVKFYVLFRAYRMDNNHQVAQIWLQEYLKILNLLKELNRSSIHASSSVQVSGRNM